MLQKGCFFFILFALFSFFVEGSADSDIRIKALSQEHYWHVLLHMKNGKTEIDDSSFFLTPKNSFSPLSELHATVLQIKDNNQSMACKYPARIYWLRSKLPELFKENHFSCEQLENTLLKEDIHFVTLVFPTAYINSPASMFGHTFLRLDKNMKTPLIGEAVNYAARTREVNGLMYMYNGLFGGYKGYYSVLPYYKKIKEYSAMEQRDMWEYTLSLSDEEIKKMLYHLYELQGVYGNYYFFTKNCSYNLLWLLEAAKSDHLLTQKFSVKVIPIDTIRVLKEADIIENVHFRPSQRREMYRLLENIENIPLAQKFSKTYDTDLLHELSMIQQAYIADLAILILKHKRSQNQIDKKNYIKQLMTLLKYRSKLPKTILHEVKQPVDPLNGHKSARISFWVSNHKKFSLVFKPAMHGWYDLDAGYVNGAYIDFFKFSVEKSKFKRLDFVSVTSLSSCDSFFKPLSWSAQIALQRVHEKDFYLSLGGGAGFSWKKSDFLFFMLCKPKFYIGKNIHSSIGSEAGIQRNFQKIKAGLKYGTDYFDDGIKESQKEFFMTYQLRGDFALNLKLHEDKIRQKQESTAEIGLFYYF